MQALFTQVHKFFCEFHPLSKHIFRFGVPTVFGIYAAAGVCRMLVNYAGDADRLLRVSAELLECGKDCFGLVFVGGLISQLFLQAYIYDTGEEIFKK